MSINIQNMIEDNVQPHLIKLASMSSEDLFEKIAIHVENPFMFKHFMGAEENAPVWDFAWAAGLITRKEADLMNGYERGERAPWHREDGGGEKEIIAFSGTIFRSSEDADYSRATEFPNSDLPSALNKIHVTFDGIEYYPTYTINPENSSMGGYGDWGGPYPVYTNYPFMICFNSDFHDGNWGISVQTGGEHSITIAYTLN